MAIRKCFHAVMSSVYRDGEPHDERVRKQLLVSILVVNTCVKFPYVFTDLYWTLGHVLLGLVINITALVYFAKWKRCTLRTAEAIIIYLTVNDCFLMDIRSYGHGELWMLSILAMDLLLLCRARKTLIDTVVCLSTVYIAFQSVEDAYRTGVYDDFPEWSTLDKPRDECKAGAVIILVRLVTFLLGFLMTRHFASAMEAEQIRIMCSIHVAQKVAEALVRFDLDQAEGELRSEGIGEELREA
eukprot:Sspe_Gene.118044::Locus_110541_Transcript_1_1_Confidence_1.000_Length_775::g.118044::m.118044